MKVYNFWREGAEFTENTGRTMIWKVERVDDDEKGHHFVQEK